MNNELPVMVGTDLEFVDPALRAFVNGLKF